MGPTANIIERVFAVQAHASLAMGTAFTLDHGESQFLISARHNFPADNPRPRVTLSHHRIGHLTIDLDLLPISLHTDVAVARLDEPIELLPDLPLVVKSDGIIVGQRVYFLGFPLGLGIPVGDTHDLPLVKGGLLAGLSKPEGILFVDGHTNKGMSGGPLVFFPWERASDQIHLAGVMTRYEPETLPLLHGGREVTAAGANSGIALAVTIDVVRDAIAAAAP